MGKIDVKQISAGNFSLWLKRFQTALKNESGMDVKCGDCNACCRASQFIHIKPEEKATLAGIDKRLLFPAPGLPKGNLVMGYNGTGCCPMLKNGICSIYQDRPITCRTYDCRLFAAAGILAGGKEKYLVNRQVRRWRFSYKNALDREKHLAVISAADFLKRNKRIFPTGTISGNPIQLAIMAVKCYAVFLERHRSQTKAEIAQRVITSVKRFRPLG
jgi:Fe-S-cluster containining protein